MLLLLPSASFLFASGGSIAKKSHLPLRSTRPLMNHSLPRPSSVASFATSASASSAASSTSKADADADDGDGDRKPRLLCLHGKFQSGAGFANKIGGARRKLAREYELDFLDGPILLPRTEGDGDAPANPGLAPRSWWARSGEGTHTLIREAFDHVIRQTEMEEYDAIIGFSQGGTLATALASSGALPGVRAVVTAGAPYVPEAFVAASTLADDSSKSSGFEIPKLHFAGERDNLVGAESMRELCEKGGNGTFLLHDQGHLFPTRSARVTEMLDFLRMALSEK